MALATSEPVQRPRGPSKPVTKAKQAKSSADRFLSPLTLDERSKADVPVSITTVDRGVHDIAGEFAARRDLDPRRTDRALALRCDCHHGLKKSRMVRFR